MRMIRKKRRLWNWYKTTKDHLEYQGYLAGQKSVTKIIANAKKNLARKLAKNSENNPRQFYLYLNRSTKSRAQVGPLKNENDELISGSQGMSNILNSFFTCVFMDEGTASIPTLDLLCNAHFESPTVNQEMLSVWTNL